MEAKRARSVQTDSMSRIWPRCRHPSQSTTRATFLQYLVEVVVAKDPAFRDIKAEFKGLYGTRSSPDLADVSGAATGLVTNFKRRQKTAELVARNRSRVVRRQITFRATC